MSKANTAPRIKLASFEEMLGGGQTTQTAAQPLTLPIAELKPFPDHKYELYTGEKLAAMVESIKEHGILQPVIVWNRNGEHIILSGHNRTNAAKIAGLESVPVVIKELLHLMVKSSVAQNKTNRDTIQLDFLQKACKVA